MESYIEETFLKPWYRSLMDPRRTQEDLLPKLLEGYGRTHYGREHGVSEVTCIEDFRERFPEVSYQAIKPHIEEVKKGRFEALLPEPPVDWVMTRGSTGAAKVLPVTQGHLDQIRACGARALLNYAFRSGDLEVLGGGVLNLNFPSVVGSMEVGGRKTTYGYSSGTYAKLNPRLGKAGLIPAQEEIDALGPGATTPDWEERFELVYRRAREADVKAAMGVTPVIASFARYLKRRHGVYPRDLWKVHALFCTSVPKIHVKYAPLLKRFYGDTSIVEVYSATEGVYAQQLDDLPYVCPNYDVYLLEVEMGNDKKMLHEMERGEWGRVIVSSCLFPRYDIGDMIECMGKQYFRVFGRARLRTILEHVLYRLLTRWFT